MSCTALRTGCRTLLEDILDPDSFTSWDGPLAELPIETPYRDELTRARATSGSDEAVHTGSGSLGGHRAAVVAGDFRFLGGSLGINAAQRVRKAFTRATREGIPLIAFPVSGGTRMQEGTPAFVQMAAITAAVNAHKAAGLPYLVYLRSPTMGGVFASWGLQGHVTVGEPGALLGFLGPKVYAALKGEEFPPGIQSAENLLEHGIIDRVLEPRDFRDFAARFLELWGSRGPFPRSGAAASEAAAIGGGGASPILSGSAWDAVQNSRQVGRPGLAELLHHGSSDVLELTQAGSRPAGSVRLALASFGGRPAVVVGTDRELASDGAVLSCAALKAARRGMLLAEGLRLPLVTVIDTPGAELSPRAEEEGIALEISKTLATMLALRTPTVAVLLGEGTGGGALSLFPADHVLAASNAWLAPLPPEGASTIRYSETTRAAEMAESQRISAPMMLEDGLLDTVLKEDPDAPTEAFIEHTAHRIADTLGALAELDPESLRRRRELRYGLRASGGL
ncbi:Acetyl-CoA carboxylase beta subunit [Sinomonas atrocyanea]|uniref:Acetyl-coenzyme A carboxylase carboxyl transferase subunits beta/alpha n=1 Tax=Sinomonas atrocyanea TaxID=37927 RepID=A0A126ZW58_9MICC|nr:carboxyl transferase domain-containing protein [Sinomonas atrocyanea]AMM30781.1 Acetyl-CoA carboxylase beta subunit [Sinomonas atrocyanea]GEB63827.1 acetyl-CoA carboxylase [Sinomonas atrocyanea]GGG65149.1 acetyl-CoA carboxylase [Sinomonas atrocyanea]